MITIADEIIKTLQTDEYSLPVTVRDFYSADSILPPLITVDELPGNDGIYLDNQPAIVTNIFTIEVYAKQRTINGKAVNQKQLALEIFKTADKLLNEIYGLTMTGQLAIAPYADSSVCRAVARYVARIDTRTNLIYRRI